MSTPSEVLEDFEYYLNWQFQSVEDILNALRPYLEYRQSFSKHEIVIDGELYKKMINDVNAKILGILSIKK